MLPFQSQFSINVDGSFIDGTEILAIMNFLYDNMHNWLQAQAKRWEVAIKFANPSGTYDTQDSLPTSVVIQNTALEIHCSTEQGTADVMAKASEAFNIITDRETAKKVLQSYLTSVG